MSRALSLFYRTLGQTIGTGMPLAKAVELSTAPARVRQHLTHALATGADWEQALRDAPPWLPAHHRPVLAAAAASGRLPETLIELSADAERQHTRRMQALGAAAYPVFLVHFAALMLPVAEVVRGNTSGYLGQVATILLPFWGLVVAVILWARTAPGGAFRAGLVLPGLSGWLRNGQIARLASLLEAQLSAGVEIPRAWENTASTLRWPALAAASLEIAAHARLGEPPSARLAAVRCLPPTFIQLYTTGEASGRLEENLRSLARMHDDSSQRSLAAAAFWYPKILYILVAIWIASRIIAFYSGYLEQFELP